MNEAVGAADVDKRAKVAQARDHAVDDIAYAEFGQQLGFAFGPPFFLRFALAENQAAAVLVNFDDFDTECAVDQFAHGLSAVGGHAGRYQMRAGDKAFQPIPAHQDTAFVIAADFDIDRILRCQQLTGFLPVIALQAHVDGDDQVVVLVAGIDDIDGHIGAGMQAFAEVLFHPLQILGWDDAILLGAEIDDDLALIDLQNGSFANFAAARRRIGIIK